MSTAYSLKFVKHKKCSVSGVLNVAKTMFKPKISSKSSNAAPASKKHENSAYTCTLISWQHI